MFGHGNFGQFIIDAKGNSLCFVAIFVASHFKTKASRPSWLFNYVASKLSNSVG